MQREVTPKHLARKVAIQITALSRKLVQKGLLHLLRRGTDVSSDGWPGRVSDDQTGNGRVFVIVFKEVTEERHAPLVQGPVSPRGREIV